ncbi:MAG TPA: FAD-dependent oxidoreductase [Puia sp.]|nr:FAD-dependent oxidoreductase [Puia sp.]
MLPLSVWESESFFSPKDYIIIGSGFTGLWSAYYLKKKHPKRSVTIVERGIIPGGASTRNAGFACFGSFTELIADSEANGEEAMLDLVEQRFRGLRKIRNLFGKNQIGYESFGGYELVPPGKYSDLNTLRTQIDELNQKLKKITGRQKTFQLSQSRLKQFGFTGDYHFIENRMEGQLHSGHFCEILLRLVQSLGVTVLTNTEIFKLESDARGARLHTSLPVTLQAEQVLVCTNAFARLLLPELDVKPARGQILLTSPIDNLKFRGCFHYDEGFYYFRNLGDRVLLGGARNKFLREEETFSASTTPAVQEELERFLKEVILPDATYTIEQRWSGTMGMGAEKKPIVQRINERVCCAVRMSGMGVALAPQVGKAVAALLD